MAADGVSNCEFIPKWLAETLGEVVLIVGAFLVIMTKCKFKNVETFDDYEEDVNTVNGFYRYKDTKDIIKIEYDKEIYAYDKIQDKWFLQDGSDLPEGWIKITPDEAYKLMKE